MRKGTRGSVAVRRGDAERCAVRVVKVRQRAILPNVMNAQAVGAYWRRRDIAPLAKLVALALATEAAQGQWHVQLTQRTLRYKTGLTPLAMRRALQALESAGAIERYQRHRRAATEYSLTPHKR